MIGSDQQNASAPPSYDETQNVGSVAPPPAQYLQPQPAPMQQPYVGVRHEPYIAQYPQAYAPAPKSNNTIVVAETGSSGGWVSN